MTTAVHADTGELVDITVAEARDLTDRIRACADELWQLLQEAHERQVWLPMGYSGFSAYIDGEFSMSRQRAYQLLDQAKVIAAIESVSTDVDTSEITEAVARDIKPHLEVVKDEIRERVAAGEDGKAVVREVIERTRDEAREHADMVRRFRKGLEQFSIGWIYIRDLGHHEHRDEILDGLHAAARDSVAEFEQQFGRYQR